MKINLKDSLLYRTGQAWKYWVQAFGVLIFLLITIQTFWNGGGEFGLSSPLSWIGVIVGFLCVAFPGFAIRCPACGTRWFWLAISKKHEVGGIDWFLSLSNCPKCGYSGEDKTQQE